MKEHIDKKALLLAEAKATAEAAKDAAHTACILAIVSFFLSVLGLIARMAM